MLGSGTKKTQKKNEIQRLCKKKKLENGGGGMQRQSVQSRAMSEDSENKLLGQR